jgi:hypothetical protein
LAIYHHSRACYPRIMSCLPISSSQIPRFKHHEFPSIFFCLLLSSSRSICHVTYVNKMSGVVGITEPKSAPLSSLK